MGSFAAALLHGFSRREKLSLIPPVVIVLVVACSAPRPQEVLVNGQVVREAVAFGYLVPEWLIIAIGSVIMALLWWGCWAIYGRIWPEPKPETIRLEKVFPMAGGGFIGWQPEVPGTPSPMEYEPPVFSEQTTAMEFLCTDGPNPMRTMIVGDAWGQEYLEFEQLQHGWLEKVPEATLRELVPAAETIFQGPAGAHCEDVAYSLARAHGLRGIPTSEELEGLADRVGHEKIAKILSEEPVEP
ncbi:MAG: hypothetical protein ACHQ50_08645 [Fimbriimonadales bacterium]